MGGTEEPVEGAGESRRCRLERGGGENIGSVDGWGLEEDRREGDGITVDPKGDTDGKIH